MKMLPYKNLPLSFGLAAAIAAIFVPCCNAAAAGQEAPPSAAPSASAAATMDMRALLDRLRYDPAERGPLLFVSPPRAFTPTMTFSSRFSLGTIATSAGYILVPVGGITAVVPRTMTVIVTRPGKANPYAGMERGHIARVLMASLTARQWATLGGDGGLGVGDLDSQQRLMFEQILPPAPEMVRKTTDKGVSGGPNTKRVISRTPLDRNSLRLRISRKVAIFFPSGGTSSVGNDALKHPDVGEIMDVLEPGTDPQDPEDPLSPMAYGQTILKTMANRAKPSDLDFHAARLNVRVPLGAVSGGAADPTLGELVARIADATGLDLIADNRVAGLDVYRRGTNARAGDILEALCRGVTGTFRRIGATQTYVLTDDREGIGTRYGRLAEWADDAESMATALLAASDERIKKSKSIANIRFPPGDPLAPSDAQQARLETGWRTGVWAPIVPLSELSAPLRRAAERTLEQFGEEMTERVGNQPSAIRLSVGIRADWVVPGVSAIPDHDLIGMGPSINDFVEEETITPPVSPVSPAVSPKAASAPALRPKRRVLLAPVGSGSPADASAIITSARKRGFSEVWFQVGLDDVPGATNLLTAAVSAGRRENIVIGASVDLLRGAGLPGEPERNILGETGAEFARRQEKRKSSTTRRLRGYDGWVVPNREGTDRIAALVGRVAAVPGLGCVVVRAASAPGCARVPADDPNIIPPFRSDGIPINGRMGYSDAMRTTFLRTRGIDPIDIPDLGPLKRLLSLPFFPNTTDSYNGRIGPSYGKDPNKKAVLADWREFRYVQTESTVTSIYDALRKTNATIPLLIDDRANSCIPDIWGSWFMTWDRRVRLPQNQARYPRLEGLKQARAAGAREVLNRTGFGEDFGKPDTLEQFVVQTLESTAYAAQEGWDGIVIDLSGQSSQPGQEPAETLRRLEALPVVTSTAQ